MKKNKKEELITYFLTDNASGYKTREKHIIKNFEGLIDKIDEFNLNSEFSSDIPFSQKLYNYLYNIHHTPKCENCGKIIKWKNKFTEGYLKNCSLKCRGESKKRVERIENTNLSKYGNKSISRVESVKTKRKKKFKEKFGYENIFESTEIKKKTKDTNLKKYGTEYPTQSKIVQEKIKKNNIIKYGVDSPSKLPEYKENLILKNKINITNKFKSKGYVILEFLEDNILKVKHPDGHTFTGDRNVLNNRFNYNIELSTKLVPFGGLKSSYELEIKKFLDNYKIGYKSGVKKILDGKEIDIYIPKFNIGIEFNGLYWHSDINKNPNYHVNKVNVAESKGLHLIHIFEDEWVEKNEIVKSILKSKLNLIENKIYARKCVIKEVGAKQSKIFLNKNHLQGSVNSKIKLGLYYDNKLVSIMTFNKPRLSLGNNYSKNGTYEMVRFCSKLNTTVIGGASKLLKYFNNRYKPSKIITYANRNHSNGKMYKKIGFIFIKNTKPNYWYYDKNKNVRYHRFKFRKDILVKMGYDRSKTEKEIMSQNGYYRIYDSGHMKFEMNL